MDVSLNQKFSLSMLLEDLTQNLPQLQQPSSTSCPHCADKSVANSLIDSSKSSSLDSLSTTQTETAAKTTMKDDKVQFENENYNIDVSDQGEIHIHNKKTDEKYRIWGDPHVDVDGKHAFDFKGDTSFVLDDGTKITVETTPWKGNNGATVASTVSIIDGNSSYGVQITGVDPNTTGDLAINKETANSGRFLDSLVQDGNYVHENPDGKGFIAVGPDGWAEVDQSVMDFQENLLRNLGVDDKLLSQLSDKHLQSLPGDLQTPVPDDNQTPVPGDTKIPAPNDNLGDLLTGKPVTTTLQQFGSLLRELGGLLEQTQGADLLEGIVALLEAFQSLANQQARPFGFFPGLSSIQSQGSYSHPQVDNPLSFGLQFARA